MADELHTIRTIRRAMLERRLRRKAVAEGFLLIAAFVTVFLLASSLRSALLLVLVTAAIAVPLFVVRRGRDLCRLAHADDWRTKALEGRGANLADWHKGDADLPPWSERRQRKA